MRDYRCAPIFFLGSRRRAYYYPLPKSALALARLAGGRGIRSDATRQSAVYRRAHRRGNVGRQRHGRRTPLCALPVFSSNRRPLVRISQK